MTEQHAARDLVAFIEASPTPYHAVREAARRLSGAGFARLDEREAWQLRAGARHYVVRGGGSIIAFVVGEAPPSETGFSIVGAHTDSPNLRLKPQPDFSSAGHRQVGVEVYGGVLHSTWLDRDLALAGRVTLANGATHLVHVARPVARVPSLAIHLNRGVNADGVVLNPQTHLSPTLGLELAGSVGALALVCAELARAGVEAAPDDVRGFDLCLCDAQPAALGGGNDELVLAPRLDNLGSSHAALCALIAARPALRRTRVIALYDHEECGSQSLAGAQSRFVADVLSRLAGAHGGHEGTARALARSFLVSADMAHAQHPNYADKHDKHHAPRLGAGPVIKINATQRYATDGPSEAVFDAACRAAGFTPQRFVSRSDLPCGTTIGPISAALLGVRAVDVGNPMLAMHSCRETAASADVAPMIRALGQMLDEVELPPPDA